MDTDEEEIEEVDMNLYLQCSVELGKSNQDILKELKERGWERMTMYKVKTMVKQLGLEGLRKTHLSRYY